LAAEMCARRRKSMPQVPPQFSFCFGRRGAHPAGQLTLRRRDRAISQGPDPKLIPCGRESRHNNDPHPQPTRGRGAHLHAQHQHLPSSTRPNPPASS
jgi:hypothetical protein